MNKLSIFQENVGMMFQIYNGLFLNLPFQDVQSSGILLPVFSSFCRQGLESGRSPIELVEEFFSQRVGSEDFTDVKNNLFRFLRLAERQVVLFDALEDSAFPRIVDTAGPGSIKDILNRVATGSRTGKYSDFLDEYQVRVVLTAHPTQFYTDQVLGILVDLAEALGENDLNTINNLLLQMGKTRFKKSQKPSPLDEAESLMWILENIMFEVIPSIHRRLMDESESATPGLERSGILELGFWPGGDRDGNPFVSAETTRLVGERLRKSVLRLYLERLQKLARRLTFDGVLERIEEIIRKIQVTINPVSSMIESQNEYRERKSDSRAFYVEIQDEGYHNADRLRDDLFQLREVIIAQHRGLFVELLDDLIYRVQCFGFHFASLDIRQDSAVHSSVISEILPRFAESEGIDTRFTSDHANYENWSEADRVTCLAQLEELLDKMSMLECSRLYEGILDQLSDAVQRDALESFKAIHDIQSRNGEAGAHRYIISHSERASHVLEPRIIAMIAGFDRDIMPVDFVPLFETVEDLHNAPGIMEQLYNHGNYREHLHNRRLHQHIMLGFSDGTKDGGYVTANWEIHKAKEALTRVTGERGIRALFFDGRGGPPARGGGNTHKFYRGLGSGIDSRSIQLTLQGQTISSSYGTLEMAEHNLGQLVSAGIENNVFPLEASELNEKDREIIERLSGRANRHYLDLRSHPAFLPYLETMTPLKFYGRTNIGSRPSKRSQNGPLNLDSLRAIPFVGAWSQMKQNIPGFYGLGTALEQLIDEGYIDDLKRLYRESLFFRTLMENSMQSLSKTYFPLTSYLAEDEHFGEFWGILNSEAKRTVEYLLQITDQKQLLEEDPVNRESIKLREGLILPVMVIQQYALQKIRQIENEPQEDIKYVEEDREGQKAILEKLIIKSLMASINASRNSV